MHCYLTMVTLHFKCTPLLGKTTSTVPPPPSGSFSHQTVETYQYFQTQTAKHIKLWYTMYTFQNVVGIIVPSFVFKTLQC